jgi:hypothetical protein
MIRYSCRGDHEGSIALGKSLSEFWRPFISLPANEFHSLQQAVENEGGRSSHAFLVGKVLRTAGLFHVTVGDTKTAVHLARTNATIYSNSRWMKKAVASENIVALLWEGLVERRWSESQLTQFDRLLAPINALRNLKPELRHRRALSLRSFDKDMLKQIHFKRLVRPWLEDFTGPWSKLQLSKNTQEALSIADIPDPAERHQSRRISKAKPENSLKLVHPGWLISTAGKHYHRT